jgi:putative acetyltransferase
MNDKRGLAGRQKFSTVYLEYDSAGMTIMPVFVCGRWSLTEKEPMPNMESLQQTYPPVKDSRTVGTYNPRCNSGGGTLFKDVLEYRVWVHNGRGDDVCRAFATHQSAKDFSDGERGAEAPLVLVLQNPWICWNDKRHDYELIHEDRIAEWRVEWLFEDMATGEPKIAIAWLRREHPNGEQ